MVAPVYARQAIVTKYIGPTNYRGTRISVRCSAGRIIVPWDHSLGIVENHAAAAFTLARKLGWVSSPGQVSGSAAPLYLGALPDSGMAGHAYVAVFAVNGTEVKANPDAARWDCSADTLT